MSNMSPSDAKLRSTIGSDPLSVLFEDSALIVSILTFGNFSKTMKLLQYRKGGRLVTIAPNDTTSSTALELRLALVPALKNADHRVLQTAFGVRILTSGRSEREREAPIPQ